MEIFNSDFFLSLLQESAAKGYRAVQSLQVLQCITVSRSFFTICSFHYFQLKISVLFADGESSD